MPFVCTLTALLCLLFSGVSLANNKVVVMAFEYPPFYQNDKTKGLSCDIVESSFQAAGIEVEFMFVPASRMVHSVVSGDVLCGIGGALLFSAVGAVDIVTVSRPIHYVSQVFFYSRKKLISGIEFSSMTDMEQYSIGVLGGSGIMRFLENYSGLKLIKNTSHEGTARQLQADRVDVWAVVDLTGMMYIKKLFPNEFGDFQYTKSFNVGDVSVVFSKMNDPSGLYLEKFNNGLEIIKSNGKYMRIMAKYYGGEDHINRDALPEDVRNSIP